LEIEIAHHSLNNGQLLKILLAENGGIRRENVEQLRDHCANPAEVSGTRFAFQRTRQRNLFYERRPIVWIHLLDRRTKQKVDASGSAEFVVGFFRPWIALVIAARLKLERINKNTDE